MTSQPIVIAVHPDGNLEYTRNTALRGLFKGAGIMQRVTDIHKEDYGSNYYIKWLLGPWAECKHTRDIARNYFNPDDMHDLEAKGLAPKFSPEYMRSSDPMLFDSYENAVRHEIAMLNAMRKAGVSFYAQEDTNTPTV